MKQRFSKYMRYYERNLILILMLFSVSVMQAQNRTVKGTVTDVQGEPIIGANVVIVGGTKGVITDLDGKYSIQVPENGAVLKFSYIGFKTKSYNVAKGKSVLDVTLEEDAVMLEQTVVTAMDLRRDEKSLSTAFQKMDVTSMTENRDAGFVNMLQGKVAGLNISKPNAGDPNGEYKFHLRGTSSLTGNTSPLIVIDGIPQGDLSAIPQDDIESIDVLKDGSAAAIYGTRGTNGVILVTTKRGSAGKMSVTYNGYMSISSIANQLEVMDRDQFLANGGNDRGYDTNWMDEITRTPFSHSHNLALTGGTTDFNYRASVSYRNNQGIALKSGFNEMIARFSANQNLFDKKIQIAYDATYRRFDREGENSSYDDYSAFKHAYYYLSSTYKCNFLGADNKQ